MIKFLVFTLIFLFNFSAFSQINTEENPSEYSLANKYFSKDLSVFEPKKPTPSRFFTSSLSMPDEFFTSNNLAKKPGSFYRAFGEIIFVQGTITDSFGVPIHNAVVEIWQANAAGKYHTLLEPNSKFIELKNIINIIIKKVVDFIFLDCIFKLLPPFCKYFRE